MTRRVADWSDWSERQLAAVLVLSFAMPVHEGYLKQRLGVHGATLGSIIKAGLARREFYRDRFDIAGIPFITLTQFGDEVRKDYVTWHQRVRDNVGALPPAMNAVAGARA